MESFWKCFLMCLVIVYCSLCFFVYVMCFCFVFKCINCVIFGVVKKFFTSYINLIVNYRISYTWFLGKFFFLFCF